MTYYSSSDVIVTNRLKQQIKYYGLSLEEVLWAFSYADKDWAWQGEMRKCEKTYPNCKIGIVYRLQRPENRYMLISCWRYNLK